MPESLPNEYTDAQVEHLLREDRSLLDEGGLGLGAQFGVRYNIAACLHRLGAPPQQVREEFAAAAQLGVEMLERRDPLSSRAQRRPVDLERVLMVVIAFGDEELRRRLARVPRGCWFLPETEPLRPLADALDLLRRHAAGDRPTREQIDTILKSNAASSADRAFVHWVVALLAGLRALQSSDATAVQHAVEELLWLHEHEARRGEWKRSTQGLVATWALALFVLARESHIPIDIDSPYLPSMALPR